MKSSLVFSILNKMFTKSFFHLVFTFVLPFCYLVLTFLSTFVYFSQEKSLDSHLADPGWPNRKKGDRKR